MKRFQSLAVCFIAIAMLIPADLFAQRLRILKGNNSNNCQDGQCSPQGFQLIQPQPEILYQTTQPQQSPPQELASGTPMSLDQWYTILVGPNGRTLTSDEKEAAKQWSMRAGRTYRGNGCGTSSLCGRDEEATYWMTNAHVAGTTIGNECRVQVVEDGVIRSFTTKVTEVAYSSRTRTDWALCKGPPDILPGIEPIKLSKEKPDPNKITVTWGCPRCEPIRGQILQTVSMGSVWYWLPNSIGGQSGSAVIQEGTQVGLLTWTENGKGSGQFTATIWAQSQGQNTDGPARTGFEIPVTSSAIDLREGYFCEDRETKSLGEYPIWADGTVQPPPGPDPNCPEDDDQIKRFKSLRDRLKERGYDWVAIINLILQLIELFSKKTTAMDFPSLSADFGSSPVMFVSSSPGRSLAA